jgi:hypothetical protein
MLVIMLLLAMLIGFILGSCYIGRTIKHLAHKIVERMDEKCLEDLDKAYIEDHSKNCNITQKSNQ